MPQTFVMILMINQYPAAKEKKSRPCRFNLPCLPSLF